MTGCLGTVGALLPTPTSLPAAGREGREHSLRGAYPARRTWWMRTAPTVLLAASSAHCPTRLTAHTTSVARLWIRPSHAASPATTLGGAGLASVSAITSTCRGQAAQASRSVAGSLRPRASKPHVPSRARIHAPIMQTGQCARMKQPSGMASASQHSQFCRAPSPLRGSLPLPGPARQGIAAGRPGSRRWQQVAPRAHSMLGKVAVYTGSSGQCGLHCTQAP